MGSEMCIRDSYGVVKGCDAHIRFTFITGVSKFTKVSLFSGLNSLKDITLDPSYSAICGYTEADLDEVFAPELPGLDRDKIRHWYNGYRWRGAESVYNPIDILLLFGEREFKAHWIETGTPGFLPDLLVRRGVSGLDLERMSGTEQLLSNFDVGEIGTEALLFQTGHLTVTGEEALGGKPLYRLGYPNREVKQSLNEWLLDRMMEDPSERTRNLRDLERVMRTGDPGKLKRVFDLILGGIPHQWHSSGELKKYEAYYTTAVYSHFAAQGMNPRAEDSGSRGRADMTVQFEGSVYLFEFKVAVPAGTALRQIKAKGYATKYLGASLRVWLVGVEVDGKSREVQRFDTERVQ